MATCTLTETSTSVRFLEEIDINREQAVWHTNFKSTCQQAIELPVPTRVAIARNGQMESAERHDKAKQERVMSLFDLLAQLREMTRCTESSVNSFEAKYAHERHNFRNSLQSLLEGHNIGSSTYMLLQPKLKQESWSSSSYHVCLSEMAMEVMNVLQNTLCSKEELSFDHFLTRLFLIAVLEEELTVLELMEMVHLLGPHGQALVQTAFRHYPPELTSRPTLNENINNYNNVSSRDENSMCIYISNHSLVNLYIYLKQATHSTLQATSSFTGLYYTTTLDDLIVMDMLNHRSLLTSHWAHVMSKHRYLLSEAPEAEVRNIRVSGQRAELCEWLFMFALCHPKVRLRMETYFLGMALLDRFTMIHPLKRNDLLLYGCASLLLASKFEEIYSISLRVMVESAARQFTHAQLIEAEMCIAQTLNFRIATATISHLSTALIVNQDPPASSIQQNILLYIIGTCTVHTFYAQYRQSLLAAAALYITKQICKLPHVSTPSDEVRHILPTVLSLLRLNGRAAGILNTSSAEHNNFNDNAPSESFSSSSPSLSPRETSTSTTSSSSSAAMASRSIGVSKQLYEAFARDEFNRVSEKITLMLDEIIW